MKKLKVSQWFQLGLMFLGFLWVMMVTGELMNPGNYYQETSEELRCYLPLYTYTNEPGYIAALCSSKSHPISIARIIGPDMVSVSYNNAVDIVVFCSLLIAVVVAWVAFAYQRLVLYVPGL